MLVFPGCRFALVAVLVVLGFVINYRFGLCLCSLVVVFVHACILVAVLVGACVSSLLFWSVLTLLLLCMRVQWFKRGGVSGRLLLVCVVAGGS